MAKINKKIRRIREKQHPDLFSEKEWQLKLKKSKGFCNICKKYFGIKKLTKDHIIPLSKALKNFKYKIKDVQPLCIKCNKIKNKKLLGDKNY